jgi:hypothetical protein
MRLSDSVWHRVIQAVQEGILTGVDVSDVLRQISVVPDEDDPNVLVLSREYQQQVKEMHEKMLQRAQELQEEMVEKQLLMMPKGDSN